MPDGAKTQSGTASEKRREGVILLTLLLLAFLPYVNTLMNGFVYDDSFQVVENPYVHSFRYLRQIFTTNVWSFQGAQGVTNYYRPMMTFGYLVTYQIAGAISFGFHLANLVLNALVVLLAFYLVRKFSGELVALIAAGLFALHPIHTEAVAWIAAVTDLELSFFYLATFLLFLKLPETPNRFRATAGMCGCFALALLSKEQAMTLPVMAMIFEYFYRDDRSITAAGEKLSRYGPLWAMAFLYFVVRGIVLGGIASVVSRPNLSWYHTFLSAVSLVGQYLAKLAWPLHLSAFYVFHPSTSLISSQVFAGSLEIVFCGTLFAILWRRQHLLSFALIWIFLPLGPVLNARWMPASVFAERYLYLPSLGFCWLVAFGAVKLWRTGEPRRFPVLARAVPVALVVIALLCAVRTIARNRVWQSDESLFKQALTSQADASLIRSNLAAIYFNRGETAEAERFWLEALNAGPSNAFALDNMAVLRQHQQRYVESLDYSRRAIRARSQFAVAHMNLAETLALMGHNAEAEWQFRVAATISPLSTRVQNGYGKFLFDQERLDDAQTVYARSAEADRTTDALDHLGTIFLTRKDFARAKQSFQSAIREDAFDSVAHFGLAQALESTGELARALREYDKGLEMDPSDVAAKAAAAALRRNTQPRVPPSTGKSALPPVE